MNYGLGEILKGKLETNGLYTSTLDDADIVILNLCAIKKPTEDKGIELAKKLSKRKKIIITGCLAEASTERLKRTLPEASIISLELLLSGSLREILRQINKGNRIIKVGVPLELSYPTSRIPNNPLIGIVPIAFGCVNNCSYCIDKKIWGNIRSIKPEYIVKEIQRLIRNGAREIRLTALDTAAYGLDLRISLVDLLESILKIEGNYVIRIGMMSPNTYEKIMDDLLPMVKEDPRIYKFIHIPVQSGSNRILRLMNRPYTVEHYKKIFWKTRRILGDDATIATDIISAFPTETDEDHEQTKKLLLELRPDIVNLSRYGDRPGRPSSKLKPKVHSKIAKRRTRELFEVIQQISLERNKRFLGARIHVLFLDQVIRYQGRAYNNRVVFTENPVELGKYYETKINLVTWKSLYGDALQEIQHF